MTRSKNRVLNIEDPDGQFIEVQLQLENGEVVIGGYELIMWYQPPAVRLTLTLQTAQTFL